MRMKLKSSNDNVSGQGRLIFLKERTVCARYSVPRVEDYARGRRIESLLVVLEYGG